MNKYKHRHAFTMIELIFVIVIIGIIAAVALPKMAGTRDDAKLSVMATNIKLLTNEMASYVLATKDTNATFEEMSRTISTILNSGDATKVSESLVEISMGSANSCITVSINTVNDQTVVVVDAGDSNDDDLCVELQEMVSAEAYTVLLSGSTIAR